MRCLEQIRNDVCYHDLDVKILCSGPGLSYGSLGFTHHTLEDIAIMRSLPNIEIFSPSTESETMRSLDELLRTASPGFCRLDKSFVHIDGSTDHVEIQDQSLIHI